MTLPTDRDARNALPVWDGFIAYFPDVPAAVAAVSLLGNKQHALGGALRWERGVSTDHANKVMRHMIDHQQGNVKDEDGTYHLAKAVWRLCALLQLTIEADQGKNPPKPKTPWDFYYLPAPDANGHVAGKELATDGAFRRSVDVVLAEAEEAAHKRFAGCVGSPK
jgi:hypothetical protein